MGHIFTKKDREKSNIKSINQAVKKYLKKGTFPAPGWLRKALREYHNIPYECSECRITNWNGKDIILEVDHINGDHSDNRLKNLRYLCPNCHSQTDTYKGRNINSGFLKVSDEDIINAYKTEGNVRKALIKVGLSPRGANYTRVYKLIN